MRLLSKGGVYMDALTEKLVNAEDVFSESEESIAVVQELERRMQLVSEGKSRLLTEEESWDALRKAGCHV